MSALNSVTTYTATGETRVNEPTSIMAVAPKVVVEVATAAFAAQHEKQVFSVMGARWVPVKVGEPTKDLILRVKTVVADHKQSNGA